MHRCTIILLGSHSADHEAEVTVVYGPVGNGPVEGRMEYWLLRGSDPPRAVQRWRDAAALAGGENATSGSILVR